MIVFVSKKNYLQTIRTKDMQEQCDTSEHSDGTSLRRSRRIQERTETVNCEDISEVATGKLRKRRKTRKKESVISEYPSINEETVVNSLLSLDY